MDIVRVPGQTATPTTGGFVFQLQAEGQHEGEDIFEKCLPIAQQMKVGGFVLKIDGDSPVFAGLAGRVAHSYPQVRWSMQWVTKGEGTEVRTHLLNPLLI